jgi:hypothetical protein
MIVTCPQRKGKIRKHDGFEIVMNEAPHAEPILRCAYGHYRALSSVPWGQDAVILEDDVELVEDFSGLLEYALMRIRQDQPAWHPFLFSLYATAGMGLPFEAERPFQLPWGRQDWGQQGMFYNAPMIPIALNLIDCFLRNPLRRVPGWEKGWDGFDFILYRGARLLRIPVYYWPLVQHDSRVASVAECPSHHSSLLPPVTAGNDKGRPIAGGPGVPGSEDDLSQSP